MSDTPPPVPERTRVEFSPDSIRRRQFLSRLFRGFALCATFFGLAMLLLFLGRLSWDVTAWFRTMPALVEAHNEYERQREPTAKAKTLDRLDREEAAELRSAPPAEHADIRRFYATARDRTLTELQEQTLPEIRREVEANVRTDTSSLGLLWHFLTHGPAPENSPQDAGILYGLLGTLAVVAITLLIALPVGIGAAIYLEEYRSTSWLAGLIQVNLNNLAGVPSVIFGILGAYLFVDLVFRPLEAEIARPQLLQTYQEQYEKLSQAGRIDTDPGSDVNRLVALVNDPDDRLPRLRAEYDQLVAAGLAPVQPREENVRLRSVLFLESQLDEYRKRYEKLPAEKQFKEPKPTEITFPAAVLRAEGKSAAEIHAQLSWVEQFADYRRRYEQLVAENKIHELARSELDIPRLVLKEQGKSAAEIQTATAWVEPMRTAEEQAARIQVDQHLLTPRNWLFQGLGSLFRMLDVSVAARNVLGGGLTLALLILPVLIVASQEAIRAVPQSLRHGALALGATQWQSIWKIVLPSAAPGILTGTILAVCRAMGEAAPLILFGATLYIDQMPALFSRFTVLPMEIFDWAGRSGSAWQLNAALASFLLILMLVLLNGLAIYLRQRAQRRTRY